MTIFYYPFLFLSLVYFLFIISIRYGLTKIKPAGELPEEKTGTVNRALPTVSIIIPARNEEKTLPNCLHSILDQTYPKNLMEIVIVDDASTDSTAGIVRKYIEIHPTIKLISLPHDPARRSFKKYAVQQGINASQNEIIVTTDADCTMGPGWLEGLINHFTPRVGVVAGWVLFPPTALTHFWTKWQALEFLGLVTSGAGLIGLGFPIICNAANFAYRRKAFDDVNGFVSIDHLASGDDDLLMQKIHAAGKWSVVFSAEQKTVVWTNPMTRFLDFIHQRTRWASKGIHYPSLKIIALLLSIYFFHFFLLISIFFISQPTYRFLPAVVFAIKALLEWPILEWAFQRIGYRNLIFWYLPAQLVQIPYIVFAGALGFFGDVKWKDRIQKNASILSSPKIA